MVGVNQLTRISAKTKGMIICTAACVPGALMFFGPIYCPVNWYTSSFTMNTSTCSIYKMNGCHTFSFLLKKVSMARFSHQLVDHLPIDWLANSASEVLLFTVKLYNGVEHRIFQFNGGRKQCFIVTDTSVRSTREIFICIMKNSI